MLPNPIADFEGCGHQSHLLLHARPGASALECRKRSNIIKICVSPDRLGAMMLLQSAVFRVLPGCIPESGGPHASNGCARPWPGFITPRKSTVHPAGSLRVTPL